MPTVQHVSPDFRPAAAAGRFVSRRGCARHGWAWLTLVVVVSVAGCRGRAEFVRGREFYTRGLYRDAYRQFWEAYRMSPSDEYFDAFRQAATRVAVAERQKGQLREVDGDLEGALASYSLGLEYDGQLPTLRNDYERLWVTLARKRRLTWELGGVDPRSIRTWEQLRAVRALSAFPGSPNEWRRQLPLAVKSVAEAAISPLLHATYAEPLPREEPALDALIGAWLHFEDECRLYRFEEESVALGGSSWRDAATSRWIEVQDVLRPFLEEAETSVRRLVAARRALELVRRGQALESSGDLVSALESYRRARFESPRFEVAGDAEYRVLRRYTSVSKRVAREAMDEGEWATAVGRLEELLQVAPDDVEAQRRLSLARRQLAEVYFASARRHVDTGRPATALLFAERAADLDRTLGADLDRTLRERVIESFWPPLTARFRSLSLEDWKLRRDLWDVDKQAMRRLEVAVLESARAASDEFAESSGRLPDAGDGTTCRVVSIDNLEFYFTRGVELAGADRFRYVGDLALTANQDHLRAIDGLADARRDLASALARRQTARLPGRAVAEELTELARSRVRQLEVQVKSLPRAVAAIDWRELTHETAYLRRQARLSGYVRLGARSEWISVELEFLDRVESGRPEISLAADPMESPSREEVLLRLGRRLGIALAERVETWSQERLAGLIRKGVEQLEAGDRASATENFALAHYGRVDRDPSLGLDAAEHLRELVGWMP